MYIKSTNICKKIFFKNDGVVIVAILSSFVVLSIQSFILISFDLRDSMYETQIQIFSKIIVGILFFSALPYILKIKCRFFFETYLIWILIFCINIIAYPQNIPKLKNISFNFFFICLPCYIYSYSIKNNKIFLKYMLIVSNIIFFISIFLVYLIITKKVQFREYNQALSYYMLFPTIMYIYDYRSSRKKIYIVKIILLVIASLIVGSRGAMVSILIYVFLVLSNKLRNFTFKNISFLLINISFSLIFFLNFKNISRYLYNFLLSKGLKSRTLFLFFQEDLHFSGREMILKTIIGETLNNPLTGIGLAGDRTLIGYTHNIFIEILSGFGIVIGGIFSIILILLSLLVIFDRRDEDVDVDVSIIWFSIGFVPFLFSSSYLQDYYFWIFLGVVQRKVISKFVRKI